MRLLIFIGAILFSTSLLSQDYIPMLATDNEWSHIEEGFPDNSNATIIYYSLKILGSEEINGQTYYQLENWSNCRYREEGGIVYGYSIADDNETILYDFTLEIGDEISVESGLNTCDNNSTFFNGLGETMEVIAVSQQFIAGEERKVIEFEFMGELVDTWVEGIGSLNGFFPKHFTYVDSFQELTCFTTNGTIYLMNGYEECETLQTEEFKKNDFVFFPNPFNDQAQLVLSENSIADTLRIYNSLGKFIRELSLSDNGVIIQASDFNSGLYIYTIVANDSVIGTGKFIVQ